MNNALYYLLAWPFILIGTVVDFFVWGNYSDKRRNAQQKQSNPAAYWEGQAIDLARQVRDGDYNSRQKIEELEKKLRDQQKTRGAK